MHFGVGRDTGRDSQNQSPFQTREKENPLLELLAWPPAPLPTPKRIKASQEIFKIVPSSPLGKAAQALFLDLAQGGIFRQEIFVQDLSSVDIEAFYKESFLEQGIKVFIAHSKER